MPQYIINSNAQPNGQHEVHNAEVCTRQPLPQHRLPLGYFTTCQPAVGAARQRFPQWKVDGCFYCSPACNTG